MAALDSLAGTYTDSEGEEEFHESDRRHSSENKANNETKEPESPPSPPRPKKTTETGNKVLSRLVSYGHDDVVASDDEMDISEDPSKTSIDESTLNDTKDDDVQLPPEPPGRCSKELQDKINKYLDLMKTKRIDTNKMIQSRKDFRNPSIYEKLIQFCGINELGTNYPPSLYDPGKWGKESYYDELLKAQTAEIEKRAKKKAKVEIFTGTAKRPAPTIVTSSDEIKLKKLG
ncbi:unnamed protein product [Bemisia tabaci]|uniref:SAP30-binding protein n=1 Tax=Bemisia tabaci TaxID=7038 RepID=A0A9P0CFG1_BEMTA|nr:unnamed protein product [Bemisia tabaci]